MKNSLLKDFLSYGVVGVMAKFVGFITIPIYARFLSQADFGILEIISILMALLPYFSTFQLESSFLRLYFDKKTFRSKKELFSTGFWLLVPCSIILSILLITFNMPLSMVVFKSSAFSLLFIITVSELLFKNVLGYCSIVFRVEFDRKGYASFHIIYVFLNALLGILFVVILDKGILGLLISKLFITCLFSVIVLFKVKKYLLWYFSVKTIREMLGYSLPLIPTVLAKWGQKYLPGIIILFLFSLDQMGIYSMATKVVLPLFLLTQSLRMAWHPYSFENYEKAESKVMFNDFYNVFSLIGSLIVIVLLFFGEELLVIFASEKFVKSQELIGFLAISYILGGLSDLLSAGILIRKKNIILSYSVLAGTSLSAISMYFFSLHLGLIGIVIGGLIGEISKYFVILYFVNEFFKGYFKYNRTFISLGIILFTVILFENVFPILFQNFGFKLFSCSAIIILLLLVFCYKNDSLTKKFNLLRKYMIRI